MAYVQHHKEWFRIDDNQVAKLLHMNINLFVIIFLNLYTLL